MQLVFTVILSHISKTTYIGSWAFRASD